MSSSQEAPALIQYACERCKTRFVLPPSSRKLNIAGKVRAFSMGIGRTFKHHEGLGAGYDSARRQLLAKMDDEAYQSFVQSFRFCHECRQFVCNECWSTSRRSCLTCVAKSMTGTVRPRPPFAPTGPEIPRPIVASAPIRKGRLRRDIALVALAVCIVLLSIEGGVLLVAATSGPAAEATPTPTATSQPTATPTATPSPSDTPTPSPTDTPVPIVTPPPAITPAPTVAPTRTPIPPLAKPLVRCTASNGGAPTYVLTCTISNDTKFFASDVRTWFFDGSASRSGNNLGKTQYTTVTWKIADSNVHGVYVVISRATKTSTQSGNHEGPPWSGAAS